MLSRNGESLRKTQVQDEQWKSVEVHLEELNQVVCRRIDSCQRTILSG